MFTKPNVLFLFCFFAFLTGSVLAGGASIPAGVEVILHERVEKVFHPDNPFKYLDQEIVQVAAGDGVTTRDCLKVEGLPDFSFFKDLDHAVMNPETGETAVIAKHQFLNEGHWTLFLISKDGQITIPFPHRKLGKLKESSKYFAAVGDYSRRVTRPTAYRFPLIREKKTKKKFNPGSLFSGPFRGLVWIPGTRNFLMYSFKYLYLLDTEAGNIREINAKEYVVNPFNSDPYLNVAGGTRYGRHAYIYHRSGVHRIEWDGSIVKLFEARKGPAEKDLFNRNLVTLGKSLSKVAFEVFGDGDQFRIGRQIYDREGKVLHVFNPEKTAITYCEGRPLYAATHKSLKELRLVDVESGQTLTATTKDMAAAKLLIGADGTSVAVLYQKHAGTEPPTFDVFRRRGDTLVLVASGKSRNIPALYQDALFYVSDETLYVQRGEQPAQAFATFERKISEWSVRVGDELIYSTRGPVDWGDAKHHSSYHYIPNPVHVPVPTVKF